MDEGLNEVLEDSFDKLLRQLLISSVLSNTISRFCPSLLRFTLFFRFILLIVELTTLKELNDADQVDDSSCIQLSKQSFNRRVLQPIPRLLLQQRVLARSADTCACFRELEEGLHNMVTDELALRRQILAQTLQRQLEHSNLKHAVCLVLGS